MSHNCYFSDVAKTEKTKGHVVIHHLNDDQKALVIRYRKSRHKYFNCWDTFPFFLFSADMNNLW